MTYIATFFTHSFAIKFKNNFKEIKDAILMPVPRQLSSSCGTCCRFSCDELDKDKLNFDEVENLFIQKGDKYIKISEDK